MTERDQAALTWVADMYAMPLDLLARMTGSTANALRVALSRWRKNGWVETSSISGRAGERPVTWVWASEEGVRRFGAAPYSVRPPAVSQLRHIRASALVRLAMEGRGFEWTPERLIRHEESLQGEGRGVRRHMPDGLLKGQVNDDLMWHSVEVELTAKDRRRTRDIMHELTARSGVIAGRPARGVRYVASDEAYSLVTRAKEEIGEAGRMVAVERLSAVEVEAEQILRAREQEGAARAAASTFPRKSKEVQ